MLTLQEVKSATDLVFEADEEIPEPSILWKDKLEALEAAELERHRTACLFDMRKWQATTLGFKEISSDDMVEMLMGEKHNDMAVGAVRQNYEWMYDHHIDKTFDKTAQWGGNPAIFKRVERKGFWYLPPFAKIVQWECIFGKLDYLKREIPYGVVLRINECKESGLFNCFNVLAPKEAWERKTDIDPIVVATIWELPPVEKDKESRTVGQVSHFFLAQW